MLKWVKIKRLPLEAEMSETEITETPAATEAAAPKPEPTACECSHWWAGTTVDTEDGDLTVEGEMTTGDCKATTSKTFAQGHDAKLKSLFIRAGVARVEVSDGRGTTYSDALDAAGRFGWTVLVQKGIDVARAKAEAKETREATKAAKPAKTVKPKATKGADRAAALVEKMANLQSPREVPAKVVPGSQSGDKLQGVQGPNIARDLKALEAEAAAEDDVKLSKNVQRLVSQIKDYAREHYNDGGWDVIYEAYSDQEVAQAIQGSSTLRAAIAKLRPVVATLADREADAAQAAGQ